MFTAIDARWGRLDALINNAGIVEVKARVDEMSVERLNKMFTTNVVGSFLCAREAIKRMSKKYQGDGGVIVNLSSAAARLGSPSEYVDYASSKGAIDTMTIGLSKELAAEGIRVNAVRPGLIDTDIHASGGQPDRVERFVSMIPMLRGGTAEEVANTVMWLVSDEASYVTGALIDVGGGR
jgi:NAD(P)-dependent dehydrogenase (short-subunit alcohol dehydrogenase family)